MMQNNNTEAEPADLSLVALGLHAGGAPTPQSLDSARQLPKQLSYAGLRPVP